MNGCSDEALLLAARHDAARVRRRHRRRRQARVRAGTTVPALRAEQGKRRWRAARSLAGRSAWAAVTEERVSRPRPLGLPKGLYAPLRPPKSRRARLGRPNSLYARSMSPK